MKYLLFLFIKYKRIPLIAHPSTDSKLIKTLNINNCTSLNILMGHVARKPVFWVCEYMVLLDFSLTVKAATLIFISGCGSAISSAMEGKSGFIYNLVKS